MATTTTSSSSFFLPSPDARPFGYPASYSVTTPSMVASCAMNSSQTQHPAMVAAAAAAQAAAVATSTIQQPSLSCSDSLGEKEPSKATTAATSKKMRTQNTRRGKDDDKPEQQKSHMCPVMQCQRRFKRLEHLKRHMRIHTLERPFACTYPGCHKTFSRSDNLSQHIKTHQRHEERRRQQQQQHSFSSCFSSPSSSTDMNPFWTPSSSC